MTDDSDHTFTAIAIFATSLILASLTFVLGAIHGTEKVQQEAIKNGHAVWAADAQGKSVFQWKELAK